MVRQEKQQQEAGFPLPARDLCVALKQPQTAVFALLRHQFNWCTRCISLKIHSCTSCAVLCQGIQQIQSDTKHFLPSRLSIKAFSLQFLAPCLLGVVLHPSRPKQSQLYSSARKQFCWCAFWCCPQASLRTLSMPVMMALLSFSPQLMDGFFRIA